MGKKIKKTDSAVPATIPKTVVAIVLDRSGSMATCAKECLQGLNQEIQTIKDNANEKTAVFLTQFDHAVDILLSNRSALELKTIDRYEPRGSTRLFDAVGGTVTEIEQCVQDSDNVRYLVTIMSDGEENSSTEWNSKRLAEKIQTLQATGRWTFAYIGANVDLSKIQSMGFSTSNTMAYQSTPQGTVHAFAARSAGLSAFMCSTAMNTEKFYDGQKPQDENLKAGRDALARILGGNANPLTGGRISNSSVPVGQPEDRVQHGEKWESSRSKSREFLTVRP